MRYLFEDYALDTDRRELRRGGTPVAIEPQVFDLLAYLVQHGDRVVTKDDLFTAVWKGRFVSESALTTRINAARTALGDDGKAQRLLRTLRGRGVRFVGDGARIERRDFKHDRRSAADVGASRPALDRGPAFRQHERRSGAGLFRRWDGRGHPHGAVACSLAVRDRPPVELHLQGPIGRLTSQIGRELGVRYVVEGSVRKIGSRVRMTAQLIEAETGAHIWADRYERDLRDIFALQDEITEQIVSAIEPTVRAVEVKRALAKPTDNLTAYDSYLRALPYYHSQTREAVDHAESLLREAIDLDPGYPEALGTLADCIAVRISTGWHESRRRAIDEACEAASRALAAGPDNSTCLAAAAFAFAVLAGRFEEACELAERAIDVHPNSTFVRNRAGAVYSVSGESDKAIAQFEAAQRMNPLDNKTATFTFTVATVAHFFARRFEESVRWGRRTMAITPNANIARWITAAALGHLGRIDEARIEIDEHSRAASPELHLNARATRASATNGCMISISMGCGKPDCRNVINTLAEDYNGICPARALPACLAGIEACASSHTATWLPKDGGPSTPSCPNALQTSSESHTRSLVVGFDIVAHQSLGGNGRSRGT